MVTGSAASRLMHQPLYKPLSGTPSIITAIKSLLQSINPQMHQSHNPAIFNQFAPYLTQDLVIEVIKNETSPYLSLFFFNWAANPIPNPNNYCHTHFCYIAITDKLLSRKLFSLAADLLKSHDRFSDFMVGKFIKAHGDLKHLKACVSLFDKVKRDEFGRCLFSFNALLGVLVKAHKVSHAWGYFGNIVVKSSVVIPDVSTYSTMIRGLCKVGMVEYAEKLFDEMTCDKNLITYNIIIDGLCKNGLVERAQMIMDQMVEDVACSPDVIAYTSLIDGYCKKGEIENAFKCFDEMVIKGRCEPNVLTYNALINGLCLSGYADEAKMMMSRMRLAGLRDNIVTHTSLLKGYCIAGRSDEAIRHFKEMVRMGMSHDANSFGVIAYEYCKLGRPNEAIGILNQMRAKSIIPSLNSCNAVLRSLIKLQELDKAVLFLKQMAQLGCRPNFVSYNEVINGLAVTRVRLQDVENVVSYLIQDGYTLDSSLYSLLIQSYCINGNLEKAFGLFEEMIGKSLLIKRVSFEIFVKECSSRGLANEVENLFDRMRNSCLTYDVITYQSVINEYVGRNSGSS